MQFLNDVVSSQTPFGLYTNYNNWVEENSPNAIKCYGSHKNINFANKNDVKNRIDLIDKWKVCASAANGGAQIENKQGTKTILTGMFVAEPNSVCTQSYLVSNSFETEVEAKNFVSYMETKFFRFLLSLRVCSQHLMKEKYSWVPDMQDYSIVWTDEMLYEYFNLSTDEVKYIESKIK